MKKPYTPLGEADTRLACGEGALTSAFRNLTGGAFMVPLALALGAGPVTIGLIGAATYIGRLVQMLLANLTSRVGIRRAALLSGTAERSLVAIGLGLPLYIGMGRWAAPALAIALCSASMCAEYNVVTLSVLFSERIPRDRFGSFTARRTLWGNGSAAVAILIAASLFSVLPHKDGRAGVERLVLMMFCACLIGMAGLLLLTRIRVPEAAEKPARRQLREALAFVRADTEMRRFLLATALWGFGVQIASPFFTVYAVRGLGYGVSSTALLAVTGILTGLLFLPLWGRLSDHYSPRVLVLAMGFWAALVPALWILAANPIHPYAVLWAEALSGIVWAGFNSAHSVLLVAMAPRERRIAVISLFTAITGSVAAAAPLVGGLLLKIMSAMSVHQSFKVLFLLSAALRFAGLVAFARVRTREHVSLFRSARLLQRAAPRLVSPATAAVVLFWVPATAAHVRKKTTATIGNVVESLGNFATAGLQPRCKTPQPVQDENAPKHSPDAHA